MVVKHLLEQGPMLRTIATTAADAVRAKAPVRILRPPPRPAVAPGPERQLEIDGPSSGLIADYLREVGADARAYAGTIPPHLFPQWGIPALAPVMRGLPYPMHRMLNAGCRMELRHPLPAGQRLRVAAQLESIEDAGHRVLLRTRVTTGTADAPDALVGHIDAIVPLAPRPPGARKERLRVPDDAKEAERWSLSATAGLRYAFLSGDFNPLHWVPPYARLAGYKGLLLHGFAMMARAFEGVRRASNEAPIAEFEIRFREPLVLPRDVGLFVDAQRQFYVGDAAGDVAYATGGWKLREGA